MALRSQATRLLGLLGVLSGASGRTLQWKDITPHHDHERGLREHHEMPFPEDGFVRRVPSSTVFVYQLEGDFAAAHGHGLSLELPLCTGGSAVFALQDSGVMPRELQEKYPEVRSYIGTSADGLSADVTVSSAGVRAQIWTPEGRCLVDPHTLQRSDLYTVYSHHDKEPGNRVRHGPHKMLQTPQMGRARRHQGRRLSDASAKIVTPPAGWAQTWTYQVAIACSYEYVQFSKNYGGPMDLLILTVTRWSGIWSRDLGIALALVPNQDRLFNFAQGVLPNNNNDAWFSDPRYGIAAITQAGVAASSYDLGHFFHVGDAGGVGGCCPCDPTRKTFGGTAGTSPYGDNFDVDFVAHEAGHQFMASHTWSGSRGSCTQSNFEAANAVELGSGATLMSYAGVCFQDDLQRNSDPYFHVVNLAEFQNWARTSYNGIGGQAPGCGTYALSRTNRRPTVTQVPATCVIPRKTPFVLQGSASDVDSSDLLYYTWAQMDAADVQATMDQEQQGGPLFYAPRPSLTGNIRYLPDLTWVLANASSDNSSIQADPKQRMSSFARTMRFTLTVRDRSLNQSNFGSWHAATTPVQVSQHGPLRITSPVGGSGLTTGPLTLTWEIDGVSAAAGAAETALLGASFSISYLNCSTAGCGATWASLGSGFSVNSKGVGRATVYMPVAGSVVFQVSGVAKGSSAGCSFYAVTGLRTVAKGSGGPPAVTFASPANNSQVPLSQSLVVLTFSQPVYFPSTMQNAALFDGSTTTQVLGASLTGGGTSYGVTLDNALEDATTYTLTASVCLQPGSPCPAGAAYSVPLTFTGNASQSSSSYAPNVTSWNATVPSSGLLNVTYNTSIGVGAGTANITKQGSSSPWCSIDLTSGAAFLLGDGRTLSVSLDDCQLFPNTQWTVSLPDAAVVSAAGLGSVAVTLPFATAALATPPEVINTDPMMDDTSVPQDYTFYLQFDQPIVVTNASAKFDFMPTEDMTGTRPVLPSHCLVSVNDSSMVEYSADEIWVTPDCLYPNMMYTLNVPAAFAGLSNNSVQGVYQLNFTTGDTQAAYVVDVVFWQAPDEDNLVIATITFSSNVTAGVGSFWLRDLNSPGVGAVASVTDSHMVSFSGPNVTVDFTSTPLPGPTDYALEWAGGIVLDLSKNGVAAEPPDTDTEPQWIFSTSVELAPSDVQVIPGFANFDGPLPPPMTFDPSQLQWPLDTPLFPNLPDCSTSTIGSRICRSFSSQAALLNNSYSDSCVASPRSCSCTGPGLNPTPCYVQQMPDLYVCTPSWQPCLARCLPGQKLCRISQYNTTTGLPISQPWELTCVDQLEQCPCNDLYEYQCAPAGSSESFCVTITSQCPMQSQLLAGFWMEPGGSLLDLVMAVQMSSQWDATSPVDCTESQSGDIYVVQAGYTSDPAVTSATGVCVSAVNKSSCGFGALKTPCMIDSTTYVCVPNMLKACPLVCSSNQQECFMESYNLDGTPNFLAPPTMSCVAMNAACPCNTTFETQCGAGPDAYCLAKVWGRCPLDCGSNPSCFSWNGTMSCASATGCTCDPAHELTCTDESGLRSCLDKTYYSSCPLQCPGDALPCPCYNYTADNSMVSDVLCALPDDSGMCPTLCGANSVMCGEGSMAYCVPSSIGCPVQCPGLTCSVANYGNSNVDITWNTVCSDGTDSSSCPCGTNSKTCLYMGFPMCVYVNDSCPVSCDPVAEQYCYPVSYTSSGAIDSTVAVSASCAPRDTACPCGNNAMLCKYTDPYSGTAEIFCQPASVGGIKQSCPISCSLSQTTCQIVDYNQTGSVVSYREQCLDGVNVNCPCGKVSLTCTDEFGAKYCMPQYDSTGNQQACPVYCNAQQDSCNIPSFDVNGNVVSITSYCVQKGAGCDCTKGAGALPCVDTTGTTQCIAANAYCPPKCTGSTSFACPPVDNFAPNGTYISTTSPKNTSVQPKCAASLGSCGCGDNAQACTFKGSTFCSPNTVQCPVDCSGDTKACQVDNFDSTGVKLNSATQCLPSNSSCPCGQNAGKCPGSADGPCLPTATLSSICPCKSSETACLVTDYNTQGTKVSVKTLCVPQSQTCPCGTNTKKCLDPTDVTNVFCVAIYAADGQTQCPQPCTSDQVAAGNETCTQVNLDKSGNFVSKTVSCVKAGTCQPGLNQIRCPSGAVISPGQLCVDLYNTTGSNPSGSNSNTTDSATLVLTLDGSGSASSSDNLAVSLASALQLPAGLTVDVTVIPPPSTGRLLAAGAPTKTQVVVKVKSAMGSPVSAATAAAQAQNMVTTGNKRMAKAISAVGGTLNTKAGVQVSTAKQAVVSRATAAKSGAVVLAGGVVVVLPTTTVVTTTRAAAGAATTTVAGAANTSAAMNTLTVAPKSKPQQLSTAKAIPAAAAWLALAAFTQFL